MKPPARQLGRPPWILRTSRLLGPLTLLLACHGCSQPSTVGNEEKTPPFSFRALDLQQRTSKGEPAWSLASPEARYDLRSSVARALRPTGVIYDKGKPLYKLAATTGTVINDGAIILLEGDIRLQRLGSDPVLVSAERAVWIPRDSLMRFELTPQVRNPQNRLSAKTATLRLDRDRLELRGEPQLEHWSNSFSISKPPDKPSEILSTFQSVDWQPGSGDLKGLGPISVSRRPPQSPPSRPAQRLKASRLEGNTTKQLYTLSGPIQMDDPFETSWFRGSKITFNTKDGWLTSDEAFEAQKGALQIRGDALRLDRDQSLVTIEKNCRLQQSGNQLQSQRCQWNWNSQAVLAEGDVRYSRQANDQLTRAQRLEGRLGSNGQVVATTPGGRVFSQLRVPRRAGPPQPQKARPKPEPIVF